MIVSLPITAITAGSLAILQIGLMLRVSARRGATQTGLGHGGDDELERRARAHGNLAENAPIFLVLLMLFELSGYSPKIVGGIAALFVAARFSHAIGISRSGGPSAPRFFGATTTALCLAGMGAALLYNGIAGLMALL